MVLVGQRSAASNISLAVASSIESWVEGGALQDVAMSQTAFLNFVKSSGMIEEKSSQDWFENIRWGRNENFQGYGPYQTWRFNPVRGYGRAHWKMKEHIITAQWSDQEVAYNKGENKLFDLVNEVTTVTSQSLKEDLNRLFVTSVATGDNAVEAHGIELLIGDASSNIKVVGDLDATTLPWWQSIVKRPGTTLPVIDWTDPTVAWTTTSDTNTVQNPFDTADTTPWQALTIELVDEYIDLARKNGFPGPKVCLTTTELKRAMIRILQAENNYSIDISPDTRKLIGGFDAVEYRGVVFIDDIRVRRGDMWWIDPAVLKVRVHPDYWMKTNEAIRPYNQGASYMGINAWFQMWIKDRRRCGKFERVAHRTVNV